MGARIGVLNDAWRTLGVDPWEFPGATSGAMKEWKGKAERPGSNQRKFAFLYFVFGFLGFFFSHP